MNNTFSLHWIDRNWKSRGYAKHRHLIIDTDAKVFRALENYAVPDLERMNAIEVKRKSDIDHYIKHLQAIGFKETEEEIIR